VKLNSPLWLLLCSVVVATNLSAVETAKPAAPPASTMTEKVQGLAALLKSTGLTEPQLLNGVQSGLGTAVDFATTELAKPNAFQLSGPASMAKLQTALVKANQSGALDSFKATLNQSASSVSPQAAVILKETLKTMVMSDVSGLAGGGPDSATKMLRSVAEPVLRAKLMPLVSQAIAANGSATKIKELAGKAGPFAAMLGVPSAGDLEGYVLAQVIDTSFGYLAKGEATVRQNPAALKDKVAAKIFSIGKK
jgi:Protein of unknown function (DUF4197)